MRIKLMIIFVLLCSGMVLEAGSFKKIETLSLECMKGKVESCNELLQMVGDERFKGMFQDSVVVLFIDSDDEITINYSLENQINKERQEEDPRIFLCISEKMFKVGTYVGTYLDVQYKPQNKKFDAYKTVWDAALFLEGNEDKQRLSVSDDPTKTAFGPRYSIQIPASQKFVKGNPESSLVYEVGKLLQKERKRLEHIRFVQVIQRLNYVKKLEDQIELCRIAKQEKYNEVRREATGKIIYQSILAELALNDTDIKVRLRAVSNLRDQAVLGKIVKSDFDTALKLAALERLSDQNTLAKFAKTDKRTIFRLAAMKGLNDQAVLSEIAKKENNKDIRLQAVNKLTSQALLAEIIKTDNEKDIRNAAMEKVTDQTILIKIAKTDSDWRMRLAAVEKLTNQIVIAEIAKTDSEMYVREAAVKKLADPNLLAEIVKMDKDAEVREIARECMVKKISDQVLLAEIAKADMYWGARLAAVEKLTNQIVIAEIAQADDFQLQKIAIKKLLDQSLLEKIARTDEEYLPVRMAAVERLENQTVLSDIAKTDKKSELRIEAVKKITDPAVLKEIINTDQEKEIQSAAVKQLKDQDVLIGYAMNGKTYWIREVAVQTLNDTNMLAKIATSTNLDDIRIASVEKLTDQTVLENLAWKDRSSRVQEAAVFKITNQDVLEELARNGQYDIVQVAAVKRLKGKEILDNIAKNSIFLSVIENAKMRLIDLAVKENMSNKEDENLLDFLDDYKLEQEVRKINDQILLADIAESDVLPKIRIAAIKGLCIEAVLSRLHDMDIKELDEHVKKRLEELKVEEQQVNKDETRPQGTYIQLRSAYQTLKLYEVQSMLNRNGFYDKDLHPSKTFRNQFEKKIIKGDAVVIDHATSLMWQMGGSSENMTHEKAKQWVEDLNRQGYAGFRDWRLPTLEEGASLLESSKRNGDLYIDPVFSKTQGWIWTGDRNSISSMLDVRFSEWVVVFSTGAVSDYGPLSISYIRAVRSGK